MAKSDQTTALAELSPEGPDVLVLKDAYDRTLSDLNDYFDKCQRSFDDRRNYWPGKTRNLRKEGADAFPWKGASDTEAHVINERVNTLVALCLTALSRANIQAYPVNAKEGTVKRAKIVSSFMKWMTTNYIPRFKSEMELAANYLFERGMIVTYIGWDREKNKYLQPISLQEIQQAYPPLAQMIMQGSDDDEIIGMLQAQFPELKKSKGKKALELRAKGGTLLPIVRRQVDRPCTRTLAPDEDVIFPSWCTDPQKAPFCFYRVRMTVQDVLNKVEVAGWDEKWADELIKRCRGIDTFINKKPNSMRRSSISEINESDVVDVVYCYQRLFDRSEGSQGIYCTIFNPLIAGGKDGVPAFAKFELLNGLEEYPFRVTRLSEDNKRLYDLQTIPELLRGIQWCVKIERDSRIDRNSMATLPTLLHPKGQPPPDIGPGRKIGRSRPNEYEYMAAPQFNPGSVEIENTQLETADKLVGLNIENPLSASRRQFLVDKFLEHVRDVIKSAFKAYQRWGPDQIFFQVTGVPDPMTFDKGSPDEDFHVIVAFDVQSTDPETMEKKLTAISSILPLDRNGRIDIDKYVEFTANAIDPMLADAILQPIEVSQQKMVKDVTDDLTKISSAIEVGARPNGAQLALQIIQQYSQQPDVAQRLQQDKMFAERLTKYAQQYMFAMQQTQNAEIGKVGTAPAAVGSTSTQTANSQSYS